jgi:hydroxymethylglutaryl-CoA lyase
MGYPTGIDFDRLLAARAILAEALPAETLHGQLARAGLPKTFRRAA